MLLLAALLTAQTAERPQLECAVFVPNLGDLGLAGSNVLHDAENRVTIVSRVGPEAMVRLFDGTAGRFVVAGVTDLARDPAALRLPLAAGELSYVALRDGRERQMTVLNPAAVRIASPVRHPFVHTF